MPLGVMDPVDVLQLTLLFVVFFTCAMNCCKPPEATVPLLGGTLTVTGPACVVIVSLCW